MKHENLIPMSAPKLKASGVVWALMLCLYLMAATAGAQSTNKYTFTGVNLPVPDGSGAGLSLTTNVVSTVGYLARVEVKLTVAGQFNGDLYAYLRHVTPAATNLCVLLNRPGRTASNPAGYDGSGLDVTLSGSAANDIHLYGNFTNLPAGSPLTGTWQPDARKISPNSVLDTSSRNAPMSVFDGMDGSGEWTLFIADLESGGTNMLVSWELQISSPPNQAPTLAAISNLATNEDAGLITVNLSGISAGAGETQTLSITASSSNTGLIPTPTVNYTSPNATGALTFTPLANANGIATITVIVADNGGTLNGGVDKTTNTFTVTVNAVNDPPSFVKGVDQPVNEDSGARTVSNWATAISAGPANEAAQTLTFLVSNNNNGLFSVQPAISSTGTLTFTPAANAFGSATVTVSLRDNGGTANGGLDTSAAQTFTITVNPVNDAPSFVKSVDQTVNEDSGARTISAWATAINPGPANETAQTLTFQVSNNNSSLFSAQPAISSTGTLTFTPAANAFGSATVTVSLRDNGGTANGGVDTSAAQTFTITVNPVNDAPTLAAISNLTTNEDAGLITVNLSGIGAGPGESQTLLITASSSNTGLIPTPTVNYTSPSATGTLTFTPVANSNGTATITVIVADNSGVTSGGIDKVTNTFTVIINEVNDPPVAGNDTIARSLTNGAKVLISNLLTNDTDLEGDAISFLSVASTSANGGTVVSNTGWIYYTPPAGSTNGDSFTYTVRDSRGGTAQGTITVTPSNGNAPANNLQITDLGTGNYRLRFDGIPDTAYVVETTLTLTPPNWQPWLTNNTDGNGILSVIDTAANATNKFYRTVLAP